MGYNRDPEIEEYLKRKYYAEAGPMSEEQKLYSDSFGPQRNYTPADQGRTVWPAPTGPDDIQPPVPKNNRIDFNEPMTPEPEEPGLSESIAAAAPESTEPPHGIGSAYRSKDSKEYQRILTDKEIAERNDENDMKYSRKKDAIRRATAGSSAVSDILYTAYTGQPSPVKDITRDKFKEVDSEIKAYLARRQQKIDNFDRDRKLAQGDRKLELEGTVQAIAANLKQQGIDFDYAELNNAIRKTLADITAQQAKTKRDDDVAYGAVIPESKADIGLKGAQQRLIEDKTANPDKYRTPPRDPISDAEQKEGIRQKGKMAEENRKKRAALETDYQTWDALERQIDDAISQATTYSKGRGPGTGIGAQILSKTGSLAPQTQALDTALQKLSMDQLVKQFSGMSKAIDTNAERQAFQKTVPSIGMDDALLMKELKLRKEAAQRAKERIKEATSLYDKEGKFVIPPRGTEVPSGGLIKMRTKSGKEIYIPQENVEKAKERGATVVQ